MLEEINTSCCFTGHRKIPKNDINALREMVEFEIEKHYCLHGVKTFISGGAMGFDLLAAEEVIKAKKRHPDIRLIFALPCQDHTAKWPESEIVKLKFLLLYADETFYVSDHYTSSCMLKRNRYMLDRSLYCISYCKKSSGGSYYTANRAKKLCKILTEL